MIGSPTPHPPSSTPPTRNLPGSALGRSSLNQRIQQFYDASSDLWEQVWGEHMHHGYYELGAPKKDRRQAQIDMIDRLLHWCEVQHPTQILDVGCGIGGSSLELARRFEADVIGITLSPTQAKRARQRSQQQGLTHCTRFLIADALTMPFPDDHFDFVWSLESGEHMPDKIRFLEECYRVLKPGGRLLLATWCHRPDPLSEQDRHHLEQIYDVYCLPYVISLPEYEIIAHDLGFQDLKTEDWSRYVAPFWDDVIESALRLDVILLLVSKGWETIRATLSLGLMSSGYASGLIRFGVLTGTKPE